MKFKVIWGTHEQWAEITDVELTNDDDGKTVLIFNFDNGIQQEIPCKLNIDYLTVVRNLVRTKT